MTARRSLALAGLGLVFAVAAGVIILEPDLDGRPNTDVELGPSTDVGSGPSPDGQSVASGESTGLDPLARWSAVTWRRAPIPVQANDTPGLDRIDGLVKGGPGLVGWGRAETRGRNQFNDMGAVYLSATGDRWEVVLVDTGVNPVDASEIAQLAASPRGIVAIGGVCCTTEERPALWRSLDGRSWQRLEYPAELVGASIARVIGVPDGFIAVGSLDGRAAIWSSPDGSEWTAADPLDAGFGSGQVSAVTRTADGYLAAGWTDGETYDGAMWRSTDGLDWTRVELEAPFVGALDTVVGEIVPWAGGLWATGNEGPNAERVRCEQLLGAMASAGRQTFEPPTTALSCGWGLETQWLSSDGISWERLPVRWAGGVAPLAGELIEYRFVRTGGPGLVALGEGFGDGFPSLFVSDDGRAWRPLPPPRAFKPGQSVSGFVVDGRRLIAVGGDWDPNSGVAGSPVAWIGEAR